MLSSHYPCSHESPSARLLASAHAVDLLRDGPETTVTPPPFAESKNQSPPDDGLPPVGDEPGGDEPTPSGEEWFIRAVLWQEKLAEAVQCFELSMPKNEMKNEKMKGKSSPQSPAFLSPNTGVLPSCVCSCVL